MMQLKFANRDESAWSKGDQAYDVGDTLDTGIIKAEHAGLRPGSNGYAAFITAFARRVRSKESVFKNAPDSNEHVATSAVVLTPDFQRGSQ